jgi:predicted dehydrogenase
MAKDDAPLLRWGILGTGAIAHTFARALRQSRLGKLEAVASRSQEAVTAFTAEFPARGHDSYEKLLAEPDVDAVYITTPHPFHADWCERAARAGKHILCEKPLTMNHAEAQRVARAARENRVFLMEAFMYRCHPQTAKLLELVREGAIGELRMIQVAFSFYREFDPHARLFNPGLGGGAILDVGCYTASIARLLAGVATGRPFAEPLSIHGHATLSPVTGVDLYAVATAEFPGGILAQLACGVGVDQERTLRLYGSRGIIEVPFPFSMSKEGGASLIHLKRPGIPEVETISVHADQPLFAIEADTVAAAIRAGQLESPVMPVADSLGNAAMLDAWLACTKTVPPS